MQGTESCDILYPYFDRRIRKLITISLILNEFERGKKHIVCHFCSKDLKIWVLRPLQEYFINIEQIVKQKWAKTGVSGEKTT